MVHIRFQKALKIQVALGLLTMYLLAGISTSKAATTFDCNIIPQPPKMPWPASKAEWINNNTELVFKIADYPYPTAISTPNYAYEVYNILTGQMSIYKDINALLPVLQVALPFPSDIDPDPQSAFLIFASPDKQRVIYPKNGTMWYENMVTGVKSDLGIAYRIINESNNTTSPESLLSDPIRVFWSDKGQDAVYEYYVMDPEPNLVTWEIRESNHSVQVKLIKDLTPFKDLLQTSTIFGFFVPGISSDMRYTVIEPVPGDHALLFDAQTQTTTPLPFAVEGMQLAWINNHAFIAETNDSPTYDLLVYDVYTQKTTTLETFDQYNLGLLLSPDGRYGIGTSVQATDNDPGLAEVCKIPWPSEYATSLTPTPTTQPSATATPNSASVPGSNQIGG